MNPLTVYRNIKQALADLKVLLDPFEPTANGLKWQALGPKPREGGTEHSHRLLLLRRKRSSLQTEHAPSLGFFSRSFRRVSTSLQVG